MGRKRKNGMSEEKRNIIGQLIEMYDIKTAADIQEALKDLLGGTIQGMLEAELDQQIEEREESEAEYTDSRNGYKPKTLRSSMGEIAIQVPQDRNSDFEPKVVPKYKKQSRQCETQARPARLNPLDSKAALPETPLRGGSGAL